MKQAKNKMPRKLAIAIAVLLALIVITGGALAVRVIYLNFFADNSYTAVVSDNLIGEGSEAPSSDGAGVDTTVMGHGRISLLTVGARSCRGAACPANIPMITLTASTAAQIAQTEAERVNTSSAVELDIYRGQPEDSEKFSVHNMLPGDNEEKLFAVKVSHKATVTLFFSAEVTEQTKNLADILNIKVTHVESGDIIYDGSFADMDVNGYGVTLPASERTDSVAYYKIEVSLPTSAGNEYQNLSLEGIAITVIATQDTVENDSFDDQYDKDAEYPVSNQAELDEALANAQAGDTLYVAGGVYEMNGANSKNTYEDLTIVGDGATVIDSVNGFKGCTFENVIVNDIYTLENTTMINCDIVAPVNDVACATQLNGDAKFVDCTFTANGAGTSLWFDAVADNAKATFEGCTFIDNIRLGGDDTNAYTFTNCEFKGGKVNWSKALVITYAPATFDSCSFTIAEPALYGIRVAVGMAKDDITLINTETSVMVP